jgi:hypothetical protein
MRNLFFALLIVEALFNVGAITPASARTTLSREEIKSMPITERPSRVGHFYGNTVRRRTGRGR